MSPKVKICVGASAGGHMNQLLRLLDHTGSWPEQPEMYLTTLEEVAVKLRKRSDCVYTIGECNRRTPIHILKVLSRSLWIVIAKRPGYVITTGSMPIALFSICAKLFGAKIVWIDSVANTEKLSMSGALMTKWADLFLAQWPDVAEANQVEYVGEIL